MLNLLDLYGFTNHIMSITEIVLFSQKNETVPQNFMEKFVYIDGYFYSLVHVKTLYAAYEGKFCEQVILIMKNQLFFIKLNQMNYANCLL